MKTEMGFEDWLVGVRGLVFEKESPNGVLHLFLKLAVRWTPTQ